MKLQVLKRCGASVMSQRVLLLVCDWLSRIVYLRIAVRVICWLWNLLLVTDHYLEMIQLFHVQMKFTSYRNSYY